MLLQDKLALSSEQKPKPKHKLREKCPYSYSDLIILTRNGEMTTISQYSVRMWENKNQKNSEYRQFSRSDTKRNNHKNAPTNGSSEAIHRRFS